MNKVHYSSKSVEWSTPQSIIDDYGPFDLDVCATRANAKAPRFFTKKQNGLIQKWRGSRIWMNPPYGREIKHWVAKAASEALNLDVDLITCLLPARTDTKWWHSYIWDHSENAPRPGVIVRLLPGRIKFGGHKNSAPFPSAIVIFH